MSERITLLQGDCLEVLKTLSDCSVDAVVTDPPYGLEFMGKEWDSFKPSNARIRPANERDYQRGEEQDGMTARMRGKPESYVAGISFQQWCEQWATECLRVLKPGSHLLAFGGSRTYHRLACGVEDAGFEIRDSLQWIYGSGFPKSANVSKNIDKMMKADRVVIEEKRIKSGGFQHVNRANAAQAYRPHEYQKDANVLDITAPATDEAKQWDGWGTALKPSVETIVVARKPLIGTVASNVLTHGTGALHIDGCRVATLDNRSRPPRTVNTIYGGGRGTNITASESHDAGRWPSNLVFSHSPECVPIGTKEVRGNGHYPATRGEGGISTSGMKGQENLPEQRLNTEIAESWECSESCPVAELDRQSGISKYTGGQASLGAFRNGDVYGIGRDVTEKRDPGLGDKGGASRFFSVFKYQAKASTRERTLPDGTRSSHPTVKPESLMQWLVRLVTPPDGLVLDPFLGSGTTGVACIREGFRFIGIEREDEYIAIARQRIDAAIDAQEGKQLALLDDAS